MALDGIYLSRLRKELEDTVVGARVDKIAQPSREELVLSLRGRGETYKLLISAAPGNARIHLTGQAPENPKTPPMFCMLLRKHLSSAKLESVKQIGLDRILMLEFEASSELGDRVRLTLAVEIMGRHSNLILLNEENRIIDAIRRVDPETSRVRQVLPGMRYALPPAQDRLDLFTASEQDVLERLSSGRSVELSKALQDALQGVSPILCREISHYAARGMDLQYDELSSNQRARLEFYLKDLIETVREYRATPVMVLDLTGKPKDFTFVPVTQYGTSMVTREYPTCSSLLDSFYTDRDRMERVRQRSGDLLRMLASASDRISRKLAAQRSELLECAKRDELKQKGDLISANLYHISKGDTVARVTDFYSEDQQEMDIELDARLTPVQNAQRYYALYRKADTAEKMLHKLIAEGEQEQIYLDSVFDTLTRASGEGELEAIRQELAQEKYVRQAPQKKKGKEPKLEPFQYQSLDGFEIRVGRNNIQNDRLTLKESGGQDIWLHTQKIPGSHTIIVTNGKDVPDRTVEQAAVIAAWHSRARESRKVPVDFTPVRNVKKPRGAKPGMVIYDRFQTVIVDPDEELVQSLRM